MVFCFWICYCACLCNKLCELLTVSFLMSTFFSLKCLFPFQFHRRNSMLNDRYFHFVYSYSLAMYSIASAAFVILVLVLQWLHLVHRIVLPMPFHSNVILFLLWRRKIEIIAQIDIVDATQQILHLCTFCLT